MTVENKKITILGAARSGIAAARLLKKKNARVFVSDYAPADHKQSEIEFLKNENIDYEFNVHSGKVFDADFVVLSPGIPKKSAIVENIISKGIPVYSELEVASWFCRSPIIAITGSNGKTTTTSLLGKMLRSKFTRSIVAGNIGEAFSDYVLESEESQWAAVEVSSFQLETIHSFHPHIVILLNLSPNHLDWYENYSEYVAAKIQILKNLDRDDFLIYNIDDELICENVQKCPAKKLSFSLNKANALASSHNNALYLKGKSLIRTEEIKLKGSHNYQNAMAASIAADIAGINSLSIIKILKTFEGVEHRLEYVTDINGVHFINDSKATTVESLQVALTSFRSPIILIAGGKDKGGDYSKINHLISKNVRGAVLIGATKDRMAATWSDLIPLYRSDSLAEATKIALEQAKPGENVLLSPACSSFDMFKDFEDRGQKFKEIVRTLKEKYEN
jgi:UDP-N-acetylmuramoylalanine--D-glutamate ligase